jgi:hypothetical protein
MIAHHQPRLVLVDLVAGTGRGEDELHPIR